MGEMFKAMESGNEYSTTKFVVLGIMLGKGSAEEKIGLLFDIMDEEANGEIGSNKC